MRGLKDLFAFILCLTLVSGCAGLSRIQKYPATAGLQEKDIIVKPPQQELQIGERLTYTIRWLGIPVGVLTVWVQEKTLVEGVEVYHLMAQLKTTALLSRFYKVDDLYQSYWDSTQKMSRRFEKNVLQGKYQADEVVTLYPETKKGIYYAPKKNETKEFPLLAPSQDILSAFYYFRTIPYQTEDEVTFPLMADEKNWQVTLRTVEEGILEARNLGVHEVFLIEPIAKQIDLAPGDEKQEFKSKGRLWIWWTSDEKRIPLLIRVITARVGEVTVSLEQVQ